jgi:hypothetical protein
MVHPSLTQHRSWGSARWRCTLKTKSKQIPPAMQRYIPTSIRWSGSNTSKNGVMGGNVAQFFFRPTSELLLDVINEDGGTTCSVRNGANWRGGLVAGWPKTSWRRTRAIVMSSSKGCEVWDWQCRRRVSFLWSQRGCNCDNLPRKIPYYHVNQSSLVTKQ